MGVGSNKIRIACWMPLPIQPGSVFDDSLDFFYAFAQLCEVELFVDTTQALVAQQSISWSIYPYSMFPQRHAQAPFDINIYWMGADAQLYETIYQRILTQPGMIILHDPELLDFYRDLLLNRGQEQEFLDEVEYNYGLDTRAQVAEQIRNGDTLERFQPAVALTRRVVERSNAVIVHDDQVHADLQARYPDRDIILIPMPVPEHEHHNEYHLDIEQAAAGGAKLHATTSEMAAQRFFQAINDLLFELPSQGKLKKFVRHQRASGINLIADLKVSAGLGTAAAAMLNTAVQQGIPVSYTEQQHGFWVRNNQMSPSYAGLPQGSVYPINLLCSNIHELHQITPEHLHQLTDGKYTIASWFWELPEIPLVYHPEFSRIDEIWVSSRYTQASMLTVAQTPVVVMPVAVEVSTSPTLDRAVFGIPEHRFAFLFSFSAVSCSARKNPWGVIEAFEKAFGQPSNDGPILVIKAHHVEMLPELRDALRAALDRIGGILLEQDYTRQQTNDLLACADAYISLHRAEGFGLGMAESMYLGKPVIATYYSGNVDFMTTENSYLVDYHLRPVTAYDHRFQTECLAVYEPGQLWAEPDVEQAAFWMHHVYAHQDEARQRGRRAAVDIRNYCSPAAVGQLMEERLIQIAQIDALSDTNHSAATLHDRMQFLRDRQRTLFDQWQELHKNVELLPFSSKPLIGPAVRAITHIRPVAQLLHTMKRMRWLGHITATQSALHQSSLEATEELVQALASATRSTASMRGTLARLQRQIDQMQSGLLNTPSEHRQRQHSHTSDAETTAESRESYTSWNTK